MAELEIRQFKVGFNYDITGTCIVEAKTKQEALDIMTKRLAQDGVDDLAFETDGRDYGGNMAEEVKDYGVSSDVYYGEVVFDEEYILAENKYDIEVFLFDVDEDPGTPYHQDILEIEADNEEEALNLARVKGYSFPEAAGVNLSVEVEVV